MAMIPPLPVHVYLAAFEAPRRLRDVLILSHLLVSALSKKIRVVLSQPPPPPKIVAKHRRGDHAHDWDDGND
ncbi:hypothetical protein SISSUDRAFT_1065240 [Sistotremastrum suecicum HHB10207 ss-3]|uniref:Uncharacterized protein n=1 Tax=Sistotremastrum suecicum HHB10207 ss-3 TaxID=1314776 RepID=A0A165ZRA3_9AGAM|nr:hypothetical protein SISSUDRAFT_1065240 [Sistotremastrum suecicum HHB10207 ss-3]